MESKKTKTLCNLKKWLMKAREMCLKILNTKLQPKTWEGPKLPSVRGRGILRKHSYALLSNLTLTLPLEEIFSDIIFIHCFFLALSVHGALKTFADQVRTRDCFESQTKHWKIRVKKRLRMLRLCVCTEDFECTSYCPWLHSILLLFCNCLCKCPFLSKKRNP